MRYSRAFIPTLREVPNEAEVVSHQLMLRAGYVRQVARGIYTYLPLGWRVLQKIMAIAREEFTRIGCEEVQMPCMIPAELWEQTGRWQAYGKELLRLKDRHDRPYCFGPTHEEVITSSVAATVRSYRDLPKHLYQIHTKFRDEIRPRFGLMRGREFIMHDGYSFHASDADLDREYQTMRDTYQRIIARCGLPSRVVEAATGSIGGRSSHEVMVLADTGESEIAFCQCGYAANVELAECAAAGHRPAATTAEKIPAMQKIHTPGKGGVDDVVGDLGLTAAEMMKTLIFARDGGIVVALIPGDQSLNEHKLQTITGADFLEMADEQTVLALTSAAPGFAGPQNLPTSLPKLGSVTIIADTTIQARAWWATGANTTDYHVKYVVPGRDFSPSTYVDLRTVQRGDRCPRCASGQLEIMRGIEVGHIFKLGTKYSAPLKAQFLDHDGKEQVITMGTYGFGIGRTAAAAIEQNHDDKGIIWPLPIAPFHAIVLLLNQRDEALRAYADAVYEQLHAAGIEVLYDDRDVRAGVKFADADLIGIPYHIVVGAKGMAAQQVECKERNTGNAQMMSVDDAIQQIRDALARYRAGVTHV